MKKRFLAMFLALVMCLALLPTAALAAGGDFKMRGTEITGYDGEGGAVTIPDGVTKIGFNAFWQCTSLTELTIPNSVTEIDSCAFAHCSNLRSVTIPKTVTKLGTGIFGSCTSLTSIQVDPDNPNYTSVDGVLMTKNKDIILGYPAGRVGAYSIPTSVKNLANWSFHGCKGLTSITIPNSVVDIGDTVFAYCTSLTNVEIPSSIVGGDSSALPGVIFRGCTSLTKVTLPDGLTGLGSNLFQECVSLTSVNIPNSVTRIGASVFQECRSLTSLSIPAGVTMIGHSSFLYCSSLKDIYYAGNQAQWNAIQTTDLPSNIDFREDLSDDVVVHFNSSIPDQPTTPDQPDILDPTKGVGATPTDNSLTVNGKAVEPAAYMINGNNYFMLRDVAMLLNGSPKQFAVDWDGATESAVITSGQAYKPQGYELRGRPTASATANLSTDVIYFSGKKAELTIYKIGDNNYIKLRDLGILLDFYVGYDDATKSAFIDTSKPYDHNS